MLRYVLAFCTAQDAKNRSLTPNRIGRLLFIDVAEVLLSGTIIWAAACKNMSSGMHGQRRPRSDCALRSLIRAFAVR